MKILYLVHQFYPESYTGTEKFVYNIALITQKFGNKVKVITYSFYENTYYDKSIGDILAKEFVYKGIPVLAFKSINQPYDLHFGLENQDMYNFAENIIKEENPDIIHVGHSMRVHGFIKAAIKLNIPYILTLTDFFLMCPKVILTTTSGDLCIGPQDGITCNKMCREFSEIYIKNRLKQAEYIFMNAEKILSPSKFLADIFKKEFPNITIDIVPHGIKYKNIKTNNKTYEDKKNLTFCYAGSLQYHKGVHVLLKAFRSIENENIRLKIYGSGPEEYVNKLKDIVKNDDRVEFCGVFSEEQVILSSIDVIVIPSICYESYSLILHEALAQNIPVIASNLGAMLQKIKDGFNGFIFEAGNYMDLKNKVELILNNPEILNEIKKNIEQKDYITTIEQEACVYNNFYLTLVQSKSHLI
ncbi:MAG: glycosyltransferase [Candidatus Micrarchaeaceae archaeon]